MFQALVSGRVARGVLHLLELVDIAKQHADAVHFFAGAAQRPQQGFPQVPSVRQSCQRVTERSMARFLQQLCAVRFGVLKLWSVPKPWANIRTEPPSGPYI